MIEKPLRGVEAARRESEERQAFLLKLSDALAPLSDSGAIQAASSRLLGEHIRANRVCYVEVHGAESIVHQDYVSGVRSLAGRWPNADYGKAMEEALRSGRTNVVTDIAAMPGLSEGERANYQAIDVAAQIVVTLLQGRYGEILFRAAGTPIPVVDGAGSTVEAGAHVSVETYADLLGT